MSARTDETGKMVEYCFAAGKTASGVLYSGVQKTFEQQGQHVVVGSI